MTTATISSAVTKPMIDLARLRAVLFPHWILWAAPTLVLALCVILDWSMPHVSIAKGGYFMTYFWFPLSMVLMLWRYTRFHTFDWFLHRIWGGIILLFWINYASHIIGLFSVLLFALKLPLISETLLAADRAMGLNWGDYAHFVLDHYWLNRILSFAYFQVAMAGLFTASYIALLRDDRRRVIEVCFLVMTTAFTCSLIGGLFPAYPTTIYYGDILHKMAANGLPYLNDVTDQVSALRNATHAEIDPLHMQGLVAMPSFHCCMGLLIMRCNRGLGILSWIAFTAGLAVIAATPVYGGHYFVDVIAGASVALAFIGLWEVKVSQHVALSMPATQPQDYQLPSFLKRLSFKIN